MALHDLGRVAALNDLLDLLADPKKHQARIEELRTATATHQQAIAKLSDLQNREAQLIEDHKQLDAQRAAFALQLNDLTKHRASVDKRDGEISTAIKEHQARVSTQVANLEQREKDVAAREAALAATEGQAQAQLDAANKLKAEYEGKLATLRKAVA
jgi:chromosome segregation ATPase